MGIVFLLNDIFKNERKFSWKFCLEKNECWMNEIDIKRNEKMIVFINDRKKLTILNRSNELEKTIVLKKTKGLFTLNLKKS